MSACLVVLFLVLVCLGVGDRRPVRALLLVSIVERVISVIGTRIQRDSWLARPYLGWGHVAESTLVLAALGFVLSEPVFERFWTLRSFWIEFWQLASLATFEAYLVVLIWQVFRRVGIATVVATAFTAVGAVLIAVFLSGLLAEAIRYFGA
ncbi:MAG: hypothetical protein OXT71_03825 [Acidobacteriota bacterium]|nr:hypothetical protein [Acidobacteriota bacterium]